MSRRFTRDVMRRAFARSRGLCEFIRDGERCMAPLTPGNRIYDHRIAYAISRDSSLGNCQVICVPCDRENKTPQDLRTIARLDRISDFHLGIRGPGQGRRPMQAGRRSRITKTLRHGVQPRRTGRQRHQALMAKRYGRGK